MPDPFAAPLPGMELKRSTAAQWVPGGSMGHPIQKNWQMDQAVVHGYYASGWVYSCATILAKHLCSLPWIVAEKDEDNNLQVVPGHWAAGVVENPNDSQTRAWQMYMRMLHMCLGGNALDKGVLIGGRGKERVDELWTMRPDSVDPIPDDPEAYGGIGSTVEVQQLPRRDWLRGYRTRGRSGGQYEYLEPEHVVHAQIPDPMEPYWGMSPLRAVGKVVDMDTAQVTWNRELVENDAAPRGAFIDPNIHTEKDRKSVAAAIKRKMSGPLNAGEPLVLSNGANWVPMGISPRELDWMASRTFSVGEICTAFGFLTARFVMDAQTYSNLEAAIRYEWHHGVLPIAGLIGDALAQRLLTRDERRAGMTLRPDISGVYVLKDDMHKASESFERFRRSGVPGQTAASLLDLPVGELPGGDEAWKPVNMEVMGRDELTDQDL